MIYNLHPMACTHVLNCQLHGLDIYSVLAVKGIAIGMFYQICGAGGLEVASRLPCSVC